ncbi:MAG: DUF4304 domain-containing protein [Bryobacterales bacterium]|nr:DUF4304 domain-containing protein [Bryobacterales bacterium]
MAIPREVRGPDLIATVVKKHIAPMLKELGYRKERHIWRRPINGLTHLIQLQSSAWAIEDRGSFTFNLGVY